MLSEVLSPAALAEVALAFASAQVRALEQGLAQRLVEVVTNLNAKDLTSLCSAVNAVPNFGGELELQLAEAVVKALPRRAADLSSSGLGSVCTAVARWQSPPEAVQPLLSALAKSVGMLEPREVEAMLKALSKLGGHEVLRSCPALLQGFLASCRSHGGVGSCEHHLDSCVAVLHHVALARQYDVELCRLVTTAWMRRDLERNNFVTAMRLVALCGRAGVTSNLSLLLSTMPEPLFQQESVPQDIAASALAAALSSLAMARFRPPQGWRWTAQKMLLQGQSAPVAFTLLTSLWAFDDLRAWEDLLAICEGQSFEDVSELSAAAKLVLCIGMSWRIPSERLRTIERWQTWQTDVEKLSAVDPMDIAPGFLKCSAKAWPQILTLLSAKEGDLHPSLGVASTRRADLDDNADGGDCLAGKLLVFFGRLVVGCKAKKPKDC
eukprot:symbB.v1.2.000463.t1/scaffold11.1/size528188/12